MAAVTENLPPPPDDERSGAREQTAHDTTTSLQHGVRLAVPSDAYDIAWVKAQSWQIAYEQRLVPHARDPQDFYGDIRRWTRRIEAGALPVFAALRTGQLVGYLALSEIGPSSVGAARVDSAHVLPAYWRDRIGDNLMLAAEAWLSQRSFTELWIYVLTENAAIQRFLMELGFSLRDTCMRKGYLHSRYVKALGES